MHEVGSALDLEIEQEECLPVIFTLCPRTEPDPEQVLCPLWRRMTRSAEQLWLCAHLGNPDGLLRLPSHRDRPAQERLASADTALVGFASAVWQPSASVMLLENWAERRERARPEGLAGSRGARCWQRAGSVCGCPQMAGPAGHCRNTQLWTAVICADAEGLPWQPDLLLLPLPSQSQAEL